jgi:hypothetical protein
MNTPVSFEIAKLLKEKGFDKPVNNYTSERDGDYFSNEKQTISYRNYNEISGSYSRPTISEVVMWIYETHNIWISIDRYIDPEQSPDYRYGSCIYYDDDHYYGRGNENPTEAYEAAIFYVLNLI